MGVTAYGVFLEKLKMGSPRNNRRRIHHKTYPIFMMKFDMRTATYHGQLHHNSEKADESTDECSYMGSHMEGTKLSIDWQNELTATHQAENTKYETGSPYLKKYGGFDYGSGIRTMRLVHDRIYDVEDLKKEEGSEEEEEEKQSYKRGNSQGGEQKGDKQGDFDNAEINDLGQTFKSRGAFLKFIRESNFVHSRTLTKFKLIGISALIIMFSIGITAYILVSGYFDSINQSYVMLSYSHRKIALSQAIMNNLLNLYQVNMGLNPNSTLESETLKGEIRNSLVDLDYVIKFHQNAQSEYSEYDKTNLDVTVSFPENTTIIDRSFKMNEALQQIISKVLKILNQNLSEFNLNNTDFMFLNYNLMNNLYLSMCDSSQIFRDDLSQKVDNKDSNLMIWMIVGCSFLIFRLLIVVPLYKRVSNEPKEILKIFLDIPASKLKELFSKCENFSNHLQLGEEDDAHSESSGKVENDDDDDEDMNRHTKSRRKKKFKISTNSSSKFLIQILFVTAVLLLYFIGTYFICFYFWDKMKSFQNELTSVSSAEYKYLFINNAFKDMGFDSSFPIQGNTSISVVSDYITLLYDQNSVMQKEHSLNYLKHNSHYTAAQEIVFTKSLCTLSDIVSDSFMNEKRCLSFDLGIPTEGLGVLLPRLLENFRYLITLYQSAQKNISVLKNLDLYTNKTVEVCQSRTLSRILCSPVSANNTFQYLNKSFLEALETDYSTVMGIRMILFIIFIISLVFSYLTVWFPAMNELNRDVLKAIFIIPYILDDFCMYYYREHIFLEGKRTAF